MIDLGGASFPVEHSPSCHHWLFSALFHLFDAVAITVVMIHLLFRFHTLWGVGACISLSLLGTH